MKVSNIPGDTNTAADEKNKFLVVGIGASAGGVEALQTFFENVPVNGGIAYVVILHLSPDYDSQLTEILQKIAKLPVIRLFERTTIAPDTIYVMSPNQHIEVYGDSIEVSQNISIEERRAPVDIFFRTLADTHSDLAVAVVLSGTGANGSMGIKRVKENGGAVFVQNPREAQFSEMPRNSIATDLVDDILNVAEIPARIVAYRDGLGKIEIAEEPEMRPEDDQQALRDIFTQLRVRTGHDFSNYKRATVLRRIGRRISVRVLPNLTAYAQYLRTAPEESHALLNDLLISVTNFFRDKKSFDILEKEIIPRLVDGKTSENNIRIWITACATGEEAYSLAMMLAERIGAMADAPRVQIFASDIDENAIAKAREGFYTLNDAADVSPERLHRFFNTESEGFRVKREIREMILFASHNLLKDPAFSRVDLITCRNLLIYFNTTAQERVMETAHFALKPGGYLFLGGSESVNGATDLFMQVSKEANVYQSRPVAARLAYPVPDAASALRFAKETPRLTEQTSDSSEFRIRERITFGELHQKLLEEYAPPSLVVNEEYDIIHLSEKAGRYLQVSGGEPTQNLLKLIRAELRLEVRTALYQSIRQGTNVRVKNLKIRMDDNIETIDVHIRPVTTEENAAKGFILVIFEAVTNSEEDNEKVAYAPPEPVARQLEDELVRVKNQLRGSAEQFEVQSEELKASNEELQAMNEELRSSAEELETSKEELQSINEELVTVNQELKTKIDELSQTNNNFQNLINSADIPTIFLDRYLRVSMFTPAAREVFNLLPYDTGRPISDITNRLTDKHLISDAQVVLQKLTTIEREVTATDGKTYLLRISPYRTSEDRISGVVIVFIDISARINAESDLRKSEERFRVLTLARANTTIFRMSADWKEMYSLMGRGFLAGTDSPSNNWMDKYIPKEDQALVKAEIEKAVQTKSTFELDHNIYGLNGNINRASSRAVPIPNKEGETIEWFGIATDVTGQKQAEAAIRLSEERKSYLLMLTDTLQLKLSEVEILEATSRMVMNYFSAHRCYYCELEDNIITIRQDAYIEGLQSATGTFTVNELSVCSSFMQTNETLIVSDVHQTNQLDESLKQLYLDMAIESFINIPVIRNGKLLGRLCITQQKPRSWTEQEIELAKETAERTWSAVERAKTEEALSYSETRLRIVAKALGIGTWIRNLENDSIETDEQTRELFGVSLEDYTLAESVQAVVNVDDIASFTDAFEQAINPAGNGVLNIEFRTMPSDGSVQWLHSTAQTFFEDEPRRAVMMVGSTIDITQRKEAEKALSESEERYRAFFNQSTAGVSELNRDGNIVLANDTFCHMLGYKKEEMLGMNFRHFTQPDFLPACVDNFEKAVNNSQPSTVEKKVIRRDGSLIWITESLASLPDENGNTKSVVTIAIDINERKKTEVLIHESEDRYRIALEAGELATWDWNLKTDIIVWNDQHFSLFGIENDRETITPEFFLSFIYPEDIALVKQQLSEVVGSKGVYSAEFRIRRADNNNLRWMTGYGRVTDRENNRPTRVSGVMFDSTVRREAEENLVATKNSLNTALEAAKMGVWSMNMTHGYMDRSSKHDELLGYKSWQEEWNHEKAKQFIIEDDKPKYDAAYANLLESGVFDLMVQIKNTDGNTCWVHYFGRTFRNEDGKGETAAGVIFDITNQKTIEKQKDEFLGIASHELKTPVTSIKAYVEILEEMFEDADDTKSAQLMKKLDNQVDRLTKLIRDLLDVTKVSEGQLHLVTRSFNLETTIKNTAEEMQRTTRSHTIRLSVPELPEIVGDEERISQVLINMMSNAIKYSPEAREVIVTAKFEENKVSVSVQDFGIGMSPGTLEKLFARFFRSDNPSVKSFPGLGLGLFISMEIMKRHQGTIAVQSERGKGSTFTMILPLT